MLAVLVLTVAIAYGEVRYSARMTASERLGTVAEQLADLVESTTAQRRLLVDSLTSVPAVREALAGTLPPEGARERLEAALAPLRAVADSGLPVQLWSAADRPVFAMGRARGVQPEPAREPGFDTTTTWGRLTVGDGEVLYWTAYPAGGAGRPPGWVVQQRRIGNSASAESIQRLVGGDAAVFFVHLEDSVWVSLAGTGEPAPLVDPPLETVFSFRRGGSEYLGILEPIDGSPWGVVVEAPMSAVGARPRTFLARMATVGLVLVLAVMVLGWLLGRRLSGPIHELAAASDAVAAGDYRRRVREDRKDELGRLARAFNAMAERVAHSHDELRRRASDLERANVEAERARREAQAASRAKSDFLATMSHEVRTPINAVLGYTELLRMGVPGPLTPEQDDYLTRIDRSSRLLIALVEDVLDFARIESGELRVEAGFGAVREAVGAAVAVIEPQADRKGVVLDADGCPEEVRFQGDLRRVQQVLLNLVSNAVKFTGEGGRVAVTCRRVAEGPGGAPSASWAGPWVRIDVEDTGIGIPPEHLQRVFEPFVQADSGYTRDYGGVGLGLSISRRLAALMGGAVTAESEPGRGSRFTLWLRGGDPLERQPGQAEAASSSSR